MKALIGRALGQRRANLADRAVLLTCWALVSTWERAISAMAAWEPEGGCGTGLHVGDLGWALRLDDLEPRIWENGSGEVVAVGLSESPEELYLAIAPAHRYDLALARTLRAVLEGMTTVDASVDSTLRALLVADGWRPTEDPWPVLYRACTPSDLEEEDPAVAPLGGPADVADRVAVQRAGFERSTFTVERWQRLAASPAYDGRFDLLLRTPSGEPAAAATGWSSRPGSCGLLEPVATVPEHRGHGYGRRVVLATCRALARAGASGVRVMTPARNEAAVRLYQSCGFRRLTDLPVLMR
jgi:ribosomal protein S18 acetylase RimI-like enzyme